MAAGLGFKTFTTGEVLTAADTNGYLMQGILVFATEAARNSAITSPQEGQFAFTKDTNSTWYYDGAAWVASGASGDVTGVTAGNGISVTSPTGPVPTVSIDTAVTVDKTTAQTLTNKTLTSPVISTITNTGTLTLPTSTDTLVGRATTDTLTNKTLTSPALTTPTISTLTTNGDLLYGTGSGALGRVGIGSTSQVLTVTGGVPAWATPASGGGMTLLSTTTLSGATTTISSISQDYINLFITISKVTDNGYGFVLFQPNAVANDCRDIGTQLIGTTSSLTSSTASDLKLTRSSNLDYNGGTNAWAMVIPAYTATNTRKLFQWYGMFLDNNAVLVTVNGSSQNGSDSAISSIAIASGSASFNGGTVRIYGVK